MNDDLIKSAKDIIEKTLYITIATVSEDGQPWNTPVYSSYDEHYNFYWASHQEAQHSKNIRAKGNVFLVIYDSSVPEGQGEGVYIEATAQELVDENDILRAARHAYERKNQSPRPVTDFQGNSPRRFYQATPIKVWRNIDSSINGHFVDKRVEIQLN